MDKELADIALELRLIRETLEELVAFHRGQKLEPTTKSESEEEFPILHNIEELRIAGVIPCRIALALLRSGGVNLEDLSYMTREQILDIKGIGKKGVVFLEQICSDIGIQFEYTDHFEIDTNDTVQYIDEDLKGFNDRILAKGAIVVVDEIKNYSTFTKYKVRPLGSGSNSEVFTLNESQIRKV